MLLAMSEADCTAMLYTELATVRVRTDPEFMLFIETRIGCGYCGVSAAHGPRRGGSPGTP
jgi:hypothetical protein